MKIFYGFLILMSAAILFLLPVTPAVYDYRTDLQTDTKYVISPAGGNTTAVLRSAIFDNDTSTVSITSDYLADLPVLVSYNATNRAAAITGLNASANRTLSISYDVDALNGAAAIGLLMDKLGWIWMLCIIMFAPAGIASMLLHRS